MPHFFSRPISAVAVSAVLAFGAVAAACAPDGDDSAMPGAGIAQQNGCMACHSPNGEVGVGPKWNGLYMSTITLEDGSTVVADRDYLVRAIKDPAAQVPQGIVVKMPVNTLSDADVQAIVDYIISLK